MVGCCRVYGRLSHEGRRVGCPPWGCFYGILAHIYAGFGENYRKLRTAKSISTTEEWSWHFPSSSFWARPLVGPRTDSSTSMPYPGFEPGTFGSAAGFPNLFTAGRPFFMDFTWISLFKWISPNNLHSHTLDIVILVKNVSSVIKIAESLQNFFYEIRIFLAWNRTLYFTYIIFNAICSIM